MKFSPIDRFGFIVALSPLVPWGMALLAIDRGWMGLSFKSDFTYADRMALIAVTAPVFIALAGFAGLLRIGPWMTVAVLTLAIGAPLGFLVLDGISLFIPLGAFLGAFPAFFIATREKQDRLAGTRA